MKVNTILSLFAPSDMKFFPLLAESAELVNKTSGILYELISTTDKEQIKELSRQIKLEETNGDKVTAQIFKALNATFITPLDREDITALTDEMDDVIDNINRVSQKMVLFFPETLPPAALEMAEVLKKGGAEVQSAVIELAKLKKSDKRIRPHIKEIKRLEEEADSIYEKGISDLFQSTINPVELIKLKDILQDLEKTANKINTVGKVLNTIVVKYA
ncbi:MAG: DUF47 family protein [Prevotellaceae bacterium]|nr:DUF47 family protein [Prevotellaceae bacterium]